MQKQYKDNSNNFLDTIIKFKGKYKIDSRNINSGDIFIALKGSKDHGENYIEHAINNKAKFVISEKIIPRFRDRIILVNNCFSALKLIAGYKRSNYNGKIIGITGSVGKTSVKEQLNYFLNFIFKTYSSIKSYNNNLGVNLSLANLDFDSPISILEMGTNEVGEIAQLTKLVKPHIAIITNIGPAHLKNFKNVKNVAKEKSNIFNQKINPKIETIIVPLNNSEKNYVYNNAIKNKNCKILTFGRNNKADAFIKKTTRLDNDKFLVDVKILKNKLKYKLSASGEHQVLNSLISLLIFYVFNIKYDKFKKNALSLPKLSGRGKLYFLLLNKKKVTLIDESYNASPLSMKETIEYFNNYSIDKGRKKYLILGDMLELGKKENYFHSQLKEYLNHNSFYKIFTCGKLIKSLYKSYRGSNIFHFDNGNKLSKYLLSNIDNGDLILAKCSNDTIVNKFVKQIKKMEIKNI